MNTLWLAMLALAAGLAAACQGAVNAGLAERAGFAAALVVNTSIVLLGAVLFWLQQGARTSSRASAAASRSR